MRGAGGAMCPKSDAGFSSSTVKTFWSCGCNFKTQSSEQIFLELLTTVFISTFIFVHHVKSKLVTSRPESDS